MFWLNWLSYFLIRGLTLPLALLPYQALHRTGKALGIVAYYLLPKFRKRALSNLALACESAKNEAELKKLAKEAMGNLMITCLEYPKLAAEKNIAKLATCLNPEEADAIMKTGKGVIFFCGHQSNWEILFLEGTSRMPGVAIGRPIKNEVLYRWILSIREKFGGKMLTRQNAIKEGLKGLKRGAFLGIVGDQGMPDSGYSCPFLGKTAWTSPVPALLSYRTGCPIIVATTLRKNGRYQIQYSAPIWPDRKQEMEHEVDRMMRLALGLFEESIKKTPGQWLWQHNRWKQQTLDKIKRPFRHESICIILPGDQELFEKYFSLLATFREIYPREFITVMLPLEFSERQLPIEAEKICYSSTSELFRKDYRFKLIFNFSGVKKVKSHFMKLAAFTVVDWQDLKHEAQTIPVEYNDSQILRRAVCRTCQSGADAI